MSHVSKHTMELPIVFNIPFELSVAIAVMIDDKDDNNIGDYYTYIKVLLH